MSRPAAASLAVAGCAVAWGLVPLIVREVDLPPLALVFFRVALSALAIGLVVAAARRSLRIPARAAPVLGVLLAAHWGVYFTAIQETSVASAVLITYTAPVFVALIAPAAIGEHVPRSSVVALALSLAGAAAITLTGDSGDVRAFGVALAFAAAVSYAVLIVAVKRLAADTDPGQLIVWQHGTAAVVLAPAALAADYSGLGGVDVAYLVALGAVLTGLTWVVYVRALRFVPATTAGILSYMEPIAAALLAAAVIGEELTLAVVAGGLAIVAGGVLVVLRSRDAVPVGH